MPDYDELEGEVHARTTSERTCPPLELLLAAGQDVLPPEVEQKTVAHLETCGLCQMLVKDFAELPEVDLNPAQSARIRDGIPRPRESAGRNAETRYGWAMAIAAMLLVSVCGLIGYRMLHTPQTATVTTATVEPPLALAPLEKLAPPDMLVGMTTRGEQSGDAPSADDLLPAFQAYNKGDYEQAATAFSKLAQQYPASDVPVLYLGVVELLRGHNESAAETLVKAERLAAPTRKEAAAWYRAVAAQRTNSGDARQMFAAICAQHGSYAARACTVSR